MTNSSTLTGKLISALELELSDRAGLMIKSSNKTNQWPGKLSHCGTILQGVTVEVKIH